MGLAAVHHAALGPEGVEAHLRWVLREPVVFLRGLEEVRLEARTYLFEVLARVAGDPNLEDALLWHRRGPIPAA